MEANEVADVKPTSLQDYEAGAVKVLKLLEEAVDVRVRAWEAGVSGTDRTPGYFAMSAMANAMRNVLYEVKGDVELASVSHLLGLKRSAP